jgi:hypothetical protein
MSWDEFVPAWSRAYDGYDPRLAGPLQRKWLRGSHRIGVVLARLGMTPSSALTINVFTAIAVPLLASAGGVFTGLAAVFMVTGLSLGGLAGTLAVLLGQASRLDAFYRTLIERFSEGCWLLALAMLGARPALVVTCGGLVLFHEYVRARAGAVGLRAAGSATIGDRPARVWLTLLSLLLAAMAGPISPDLAPGVVTMVMVIWSTIAVIGLGQLLTIVRKVLA